MFRLLGVAEQNSGPVAEGEMAAQLVCTGCCRNLKLGIQCELCRHWYHYSCRNVKVPVAEREKWSCDKYRTERIRMLQNVLRQIDELKSRNRELEEMLQLVGAGKRDTVVKQQYAKCMDDDGVLSGD
jgi:hypothetical protein